MEIILLLIAGIWLIVRHKKKKRQKSANMMSRDGVAYATFSAISEDCSEAKRLDGLHVLLSNPIYKQISPPTPSCTHSKPCTCIWIYVMKTESGSMDTARFIQDNGGTATPQEIDSFCNQRNADRRIAFLREKANEQVTDALTRAETLKTTKGKISRLKVMLGQLNKAYDGNLEDPEISKQIQRIENRVRELDRENLQ